MTGSRCPGDAERSCAPVTLGDGEVVVGLMNDGVNDDGGALMSPASWACGAGELAIVTMEEELVTVSHGW